MGKMKGGELNEEPEKTDHEPECAETKRHKDHDR